METKTITIKLLKNLIPIMIILLGFFVFMNTLFSTNSQLNQLAHQYEKQQTIYQREIKRKEELGHIDDLTQENIDEIIIREARKKGYCFPDEEVFYDTNG